MWHAWGKGRGVYRVLVGRPEGKRPLGRPRRKWEDNIKMDLREIGIDGANWIQLAQDRVRGGFCEHGNEPVELSMRNFVRRYKFSLMFYLAVKLHLSL
jgi:hypothetical protein